MDSLERFTVEQLRTPPDPRRFVWDPWIPAERVSVLVGAGGTSKTGLAVRIAVAHALGEPLFGHVMDAGRVIYVTAEDRADDLRRHLFEAQRGRSDEELERLAERLVVADVVGRGFKLTRMLGGAPAVTQQAQELAQVCQDFGASLAILDTLSRVNGGDEGNESLARAVEAGELITREANAAVTVLHHVGKVQMRDNAVDQYGGRGGTALSDNARSVFHLSVVPSRSTAPVAGAAELIANGSLLQLAHVKSNLAPAAPSVYLRREAGAYAARLIRLRVEFDADPTATAWGVIARWLAIQREVLFPTRATIDTAELAGLNRALRRRALQFGLERELVAEIAHPRPRGNAKFYLKLAERAD